MLASARYWMPLVGALACVIAAQYAGNPLTWILLIAAFGLFLDGATAMWARAAGTGGMGGHRQ